MKAEVAIRSDVQRLAGQLPRLASAWRIWFARWTGVTVGDDCRVEAGAQIALASLPARRGQIALGNRVEVCTRALLHPWGGRIALADDVHLGPNSVLYGHGGIRIGAQTLISPGCHLIAANHTVPLPEIPIRSQPDLPGAIEIGRDVWIGAGAFVLAGVTIGDGCVVGAGAVVTRDLPAQSIALGVPARVTGSRFPATAKK